jgi:hypothetical protein
MSTAVSAIIVNYNAGLLLKNCVNALLNCPLDIEIIVADNASSDGSIDALPRAPCIHIIRNSANLGFAAACNRGTRIATAPFLLFLNPDCFFKPGSLVQLLDTIEGDGLVGMAGGFLANFDGTEQAGGRRAVPTPWRSFVRAFGLARFSHRWPRLFYDFHLHNEPRPDHAIEVEAISGACMLIRREALQSVGEWDEDYFLHCEDLDLCMRFRQRGWKIMFVPSAHITHALGVCGKDRRVFVEWHKHRGMIRFYRKFFRHQYPLGLMGLVTVGVWFRFVLVAAYYATKRIGRALGVKCD